MQNQLDNRAYAGFWVRFVAFAIDNLIAAVAVGVIKMPFAFAAMGGVKFLKANFIFQYSFLDVLGYIGVAAYFVLLTYFCHSTPGKMLFRLEVVTTKENWTFLNILYRETVGRFLSSLLCIGYLAVLVQQRKQGFHDMLCDTYVVYKNMVTVPVKPMRPAVATPMGGSGSGFAVPQNQPVRTVPSVGESDSGFAAPQNQPVPERDAVIPTTPEHPTSYDNLNPDSTSLDIQKKSE